MKTKLISLIAVIVTLILAACSPSGIVNSPAEEPTPGIEAIPITGYQPVTVDHVDVEVGVGSPIPVHVIASGSLPDTCAQIEYTEIKQEGSNFKITLSAVPSDVEGCVPDSLPFRFVIPLNIVNLPAGSYTVEVNGSRADFDVSTANTTSSQPEVDSVITKDDIQVDGVNVEIGVGSPIPVHAVVGLNLPNTCAQIGEIRLHREGNIFYIRLIADIAERPDCKADSIPFRLEIPLNMVGLDPAEYTVNVNGTSTNFSWDPASSAAPAGSFQLTYIGADGNVWYHPGLDGQPQQITADATGSTINTDAGSINIAYYFPQISSDGQWIAYRRDAGTPVASGLQFSYGLWIHNVKTGESQVILEELPAGFDWKPGTHLLAYGLGVPEGYFSFRGDPPDASLARGVMGFDADTGTAVELVQPERGYALYNIQWSPDGRYLGFDELVYIEGRGPFGYFDFETSEYIAWEKAIGNYVWDLDRAQIVYDQMVYVATGTEDIFARPLEVDRESQLTDFAAETEYAFSPALSPDGERIAFLAGLEGPDSQTYMLFVQDLAGGEARSLGSFVSVNHLHWSPDGESLLFSAGPWESQQLFAVNVSDGTATVLGSGTMLDVAGG